MTRLNRVLMVGLGVGALCLASCSRESPDRMYAAAEAAARNVDTFDQATAQFRTFLDRYPKHAQAPNALKQLAMIAQQKGDFQGAIEYYARILADFPKCDQADEAQFMIAFIYEEYLRDLDKARAAYQLVIDNYPTSELAVSARQLLPNVGRDPEEWVEFQDGPPAP